MFSQSPYWMITADTEIAKAYKYLVAVARVGIA